jgi:hypothetical protein
MLEEKEETVRTRASRIMVNISSTKLKHITTFCRWDEIEGLIFTNSKDTGFWYIIDPLTGMFLRTKARGTHALTSDSPRGVIERDRAWLYPFLNTVPGGKAVLDRFSGKDPTTTPTTPKKEEPMEKVQMPGPAATSGHGFKPVVKTSTRRMVLTEHARVIALAPHEVVLLLRGCGVEVPDKAEITMKDGYVTLTWTDNTETQEG